MSTGLGALLGDMAPEVWWVPEAEEGFRRHAGLLEKADMRRGRHSLSWGF